ncbi:PRP38-domain-containing protein [Ramicandelaber brevisporus]|nr:PRP38-domain-containing protein [Ramicandelaber brevisporus]
MQQQARVRGQDPQRLLEPGLRSRILGSFFWKQECFSLNMVRLVDRAASLTCIGGSYTAHQRPTEFIGLLLRLLQLQPALDVIDELLQQPHFKYMRALAALYVRLVCNPADVYPRLDPLYEDGRKLRRLLPSGEYDIIHMDEFVDELARGSNTVGTIASIEQTTAATRVCGILLPRMPARFILEDAGEVQPRISSVMRELAAMEDSSSDDDSDEDEDDDDSDENENEDTDDIESSSRSSN